MIARLSGAVFAALVVVLLSIAGPSNSAETSLLAAETSSGRHAFTVELAVTGAERSKGLMYRRSMAEDAGMLFDFGVDEEASMWMRNTYIPLDMIFIRPDGSVHRIAKNTTPFSTEIIESKGPVRAVLELNAGVADRIGLKRGDTIHHPMFGNAE